MSKASWKTPRELMRPGDRHLDSHRRPDTCPRCMEVFEEHRKHNGPLRDVKEDRR